MKSYLQACTVLCFVLLASFPLIAQQVAPTDTAGSHTDSSQLAAESYLMRQKEQQRIDSMIAVQLQKELEQVNTDSRRRKQLEDSLIQLSKKDSVRKAEQLQKIARLRQLSTGYPVMLLNDTLFFVYTRIGSFSAADRAQAISDRVTKLYEDAFFNADSLSVVQNEVTYDIVYKNDQIIMSVTSLDALWYDKPSDELANTFLDIIRKEVISEKEANSFINWLKRIGYILLIIIGIGTIIFGINRFFRYSAGVLGRNKTKYFRGYTVRNAQILTPEQHYQFALRINGFLRIAIILLSVYLTLPLFFSVFPQTKPIADVLWHWITTPAIAILHSIIAFLPNLFTIIVIYIAIRYLIKLVRYFASEIDRNAIQVNGFYREWAWPTYNIVKFLIYAFMFVLIFPYLPGSESEAFKGVSVFLGILFSLGSSSAIANIIAGLVITYMRPFRVGDRVKIGEVVGDVIEKTMLVTRVRTIKNEDITVPNSTILNSNTINYSTNAQHTGLIVHTTITIGYDVPWKDVHQVLIDAALKTDEVLQTPLPFVLQTSLDDFYVSYQINAYTKEANKQAGIYSQLHQHIQDICNERGIEIMSPHYSAMRDGNMTTIPKNYVPPGYKVPSFNVTTNSDTDK